MDKIFYYDPDLSRVVEENTFGKKFLNFLYNSYLGYLCQRFFISKFFSSLYTKNHFDKSSLFEVDTFIKNYNINDSDFIPFEKKSYECFNDYFIRTYKPGLRNFSHDIFSFSAPCEARYLLFDPDLDPLFEIKGKSINLKSLLDDNRVYNFIKKPIILVARLAPMDYHHFHFPVDCKVLEQKSISGYLHSVTPIATKLKGKVFLDNYRHVSLLSNDYLNYFYYVEVGALTVGKINQSYKLNQSYHSGDRKGYFEFGASTVILVLDRDKIEFCDDLIEYSKKKTEVLFKLGTVIGKVKA